MAEPAPLDDLAEQLCEDDSNMADSICETAEDAKKYPGWRESSEARRDVFRAKAREKISAA